MAESQFQFKNHPVVILMGVCGSGKSTVANELAGRLDLPFLEGDECHPEGNVKKMSQGIALTDEDRWPWLTAIGKLMAEKEAQSGGIIASCSALKKSYRMKLSQAIGLPVLFVLLDGERQTLLDRMQARENHYMPVSLLDSQLDILQRPEQDEPALILSIENDVVSLVENLQTSLSTMSKS